jgi:uncharacterized membrane protein
VGICIRNATASTFAHNAAVAIILMRVSKRRLWVVFKNVETNIRTITRRETFTIIIGGDK